MKDASYFQPKIYPMRGIAQTKPFKDQRLEYFRAKVNGSHYQIRRVGVVGGKVGKARVPHGIYDFVITVAEPRTVYIVRAPECYVKSVKDDDRGHSSIAKHEGVYFAGEVEFESGELVEWTQKSGHYQIGADDGGNFQSTRAQVQTRGFEEMLPISKFADN